MIQEKQQRAHLSSKHRLSCSGPGRKPRFSSCSVGALAQGPSQSWPLCFLARPCEFRLCCNLQAKLLPPVHILTLKLDLPPNSIYHDKGAETTERFQPENSALTLTPQRTVHSKGKCPPVLTPFLQQSPYVSGTGCPDDQDCNILRTQHFMEENSNL